MAINIEMTMKQADSTYQTLYPKTLGSLIDGKVSSASSADTATSATSATSASKLSTARSVRTNLASTSAVNFDGSSNITPGVNGILGVSNGGTGVSSYSSLATKISSYLSSGGVQAKFGTRSGSGATSFTISTGATNAYPLFASVVLGADGARIMGLYSDVYADKTWFATPGSSNQSKYAIVSFAPDTSNSTFSGEATYAFNHTSQGLASIYFTYTKSSGTLQIIANDTELMNKINKSGVTSRWFFIYT